jgi:Arginase family
MLVNGRASYYHSLRYTLTRSFLCAIETLYRRRICGADVVEFNPLRDKTGFTAMVAAKLVREIAATVSLQQSAAAASTHSHSHTH